MVIDNMNGKHHDNQGGVVHFTFGGLWVRYRSRLPRGPSDLPLIQLPAMPKSPLSHGSLWGCGDFMGSDLEGTNKYSRARAYVAVNLQGV